MLTGLGHVLGAPCDPRLFLRVRKNRKFMGLQDDLAVVAAGRALESAGLADATLGERAGLYLAVGYIPFERADIDSLMERTRERPLVTGVMTPRAALVFAVTLEVAAFAWLLATVNLLSAVLAVSATFFYVFVYTLWLKRTSTHNIVIGGAAGAVPVLVGWSAVTNSLAWAPVVLFLVMFFWTPPHFWALAIKYRDDYAAAGVPMLPAVASLEETASRIILYTVILVALSVVFAPVAGMGGLYLVSALVLGAVFGAFALAVRRDPGERTAMRLFTYSITYITLLFGAITLDVVV